LRLNYEYDNDRQATKPKHGKVDPANSPHVGGNTWAGGSGGADTAGLGTDIPLTAHTARASYVWGCRR
jgi:hypothetical protein